MADKSPAIVTLGGGGGHAMLLSTLIKHRHRPPISDSHITAITTAADSGGSTGVFRDAYADHGIGGWLGDAGKCLAALIEDQQLADVLRYRFTSGPVQGHTLKNVLLTAAMASPHYADDPTDMLARLCGLFGVTPHQVMPITHQPTTLHVAMGGKTISGETYIDTIARNPLWDPTVHPITKVWLDPQPVINPAAAAALAKATVIIIAPGDLFTSILPLLLVTGVKEAINANYRAPVVVILNLMTKVGETDGYQWRDFVQRIENCLGRQVSAVVANTKSIPNDVLDRYCRQEHKVAMIAPSDDVSTLEGRKLFTGDLWQLDDAGHVVHDQTALYNLLVDIIQR